MDEHYYRDKIPKHFAGLFFDRAPTERIDDKWVSLSPVVYSEKHPVSKGVMLWWGKKNHVDLYNIATGNIIEKDGNKYYEVFPELYDWKQATLIVNVLRIITLHN